MSASPYWFGRDGEARFGWLHVSESGAATAGVVLAPTVGLEAMSAHYAYRLLAIELEQAGLAVLRFDYQGSGDSAGSLRTVTVDTWIKDIRAAMESLRMAGVAHIAVVGLRMGALLGALACSEDADVDALVMWDPFPSGRAFLHQQRALARLSIGGGDPDDADGDLELLGMVLPNALSAELEALDVRSIEGRLGNSVLALTREGSTREAAFVARLEGEQTTWGEIAGQDALLDVVPGNSTIPVAAVVPTSTITAIGSWLSERLPGQRAAVTFDGHRRVSIVTELGATVLEHPTEIGPAELFGIVTEPSGEVDPQLPTLIFLNAGLLHHIGPSRLWVDLARSFAAHGFRSLRVDLSGLGDSGVHYDQKWQLTYPPEALIDIADAATAISPEDPSNVIFVGLCSGAYHAVEAGLALRARGVCLINPVFTFVPPELLETGSLDPGRSVAQPHNAVVRRLWRVAPLRTFVARWFPSGLWWVLDRLNLQPSPGRGLFELLRAEVNVMVLCGEHEALQFTHRARFDLRRLMSSPRLSFEVLSSSDHTLFGASARRRAAELLVTHVVTHFSRADADNQAAVA